MFFVVLLLAFQVVSSFVAKWRVQAEKIRTYEED
jgi:hypothetical protein